MKRLGSDDLERILGLVHALGEVADADEFLDVCLRGVMDLVPCVVASMNEVVPSANRVAISTRPESFIVPFGATEALARLADEHPLISHIAMTGDGSAHRMSDFWTQEHFHRSDLYDQVYRPMGIEYQMAVGFPVPRPIVVGLAMNREERDFSDRDVLVINTVRPHLVQGWRTVRDRLRFESMVEVATDGLSGVGSGVVVLWDPPAALPQGVLETIYRYFGAPERRSLLPSRVKAWMQGERARLRHDALELLRPLSVQRDGRRAVLRYLPPRDHHPGGIWVSEHATPGDRDGLARLGLSPREAEIVSHIAMGLSNAEVARRLDLAPGTVKRHLENVYRKLGVRGRAQLNAFVLEALGANVYEPG